MLSVNDYVVFQLGDPEMIALHAAAWPWICTQGSKDYHKWDFQASEQEALALKEYIRQTFPHVHTWLGGDDLDLTTYAAYLQFWPEIHGRLYSAKMLEKTL